MRRICPPLTLNGPSGGDPCARLIGFRALCLVYVAVATQHLVIANVIIFGRWGSSRMKKSITAAALSLVLLSSAAVAQERTGDAALGALSGALVLGPVGAVAGAIVGYTAGPSIASAWGVRRSSHPPRRSPGPGPNASYKSSAPPQEAYAAIPAAAAAPPPSVPTSGSALPPVQPLE